MHAQSIFGQCSSPILCNRGSFYYVEARWEITFPLDFPAISFAKASIVLKLLSERCNVNVRSIFAIMYAPGNGFPFQGPPNGAPGNANAAGTAAGAAAGGNNNNNNFGAQNNQNNNNMNNNAYGFNPAWNPTQQAAYAAQFGGAYMPQFAAGMPAGGGGVSGMGGGMFGGTNNPPNNMHGGGGGVGVGPIPPGFANAFHAMNVGAAGGGGGVNGGAAAPAAIPPGMPPNQGRPFQYPAGPAPMGGVFPGQFMGMPPPGVLLSPTVKVTDVGAERLPE